MRKSRNEQLVANHYLPIIIVYRQRQHKQQTNAFLEVKYNVRIGNKNVVFKGLEGPTLIHNK